MWQGAAREAPKQLGLALARPIANTGPHPCVTPFQWALRRSYANVVPFPLAQTGEGIEECELVQWFVKEGDHVREFDRLCEVQSDKATIEITSRYTGLISKLHHAKGAIVKVGATLVDIQLTAEAQGSGSAEQPNPKQSTPTTPPDTPPSGPASPPPVTAAGPSMPAAAAAAPTAATTASATASAPVSATASATTATSADSGAVLTSPAVRRIAREAGVELSKVSGSGPGGRITREDVERYISQAAASLPHVGGAARAAPPPSPAAVAAAGAAAACAEGQVQAVAGRMALRGFRRAMVKSMTAVATIPHFHYMDDIGVDALTQVRKALAADPSLGGAKLTLLPFVIKAMSVALSQHPLLNSSLAPSGEELLLHPHHHIGVAMATPHGLVVPNIKHVERRSVGEVARELMRLQGAAASNKLSTADITGGTITVSNIGTIGGIYAAPLVNPPEVAIVALGRSRQVPSFTPDGRVVPRTVLAASWGADHRVVDGAALAEFSNTWKALLEEPSKLLMCLR